MWVGSGVELEESDKEAPSGGEHAGSRLAAKRGSFPLYEWRLNASKSGLIKILDSLPGAERGQPLLSLELPGMDLAALAKCRARPALH